jgi:hypothetical protein
MECIVPQSSRFRRESGWPNSWRRNSRPARATAAANCRLVGNPLSEASPDDNDIRFFNVASGGMRFVCKRQRAFGNFAISENGFERGAFAFGFRLLSAKPLKKADSFVRHVICSDS